MKSWSVSCDHLVERCTLHQCQSCGDTYTLQWKRQGGVGGWEYRREVKPFDHLCFKVLSPSEAEVADVDVVGKGEGELPVGHVVLVHIPILKPSRILWVGEEPFVVLTTKHMHQMSFMAALYRKGKRNPHFMKTADLFQNSEALQFSEQWESWFETKPVVEDRPTYLDCKPPSLLQVETKFSIVNVIWM